MTDALQLRGVELSTHGKDVLISGYVPACATTGALREAFGGETADANAADPWTDEPLADAAERSAAAAAARTTGACVSTSRGTSTARSPIFSRTPCACLARGGRRETTRRLPPSEHFYQAQKFSGVADPAAADAMERIRAASSPEEAARIGRALQRARPSLIRPDWARSSWR